MNRGKLTQLGYVISTHSVLRINRMASLGEMLQILNTICGIHLVALSAFLNEACKVAIRAEPVCAHQKWYYYTICAPRSTFLNDNHYIYQNFLIFKHIFGSLVATLQDV